MPDNRADRLPRPPKGERIPGSGRKKGQPNLATVALKTLVEQLVNNPRYQARLRRDFEGRRVHPTIEALVWAHVVGKPVERVQLQADVSVSGRLAEEREAFALLEVRDMELLAAESQALVDRALMLARRAKALPDVVVASDPVENLTESLGKTDQLPNITAIIRPTPPKVYEEE